MERWWANLKISTTPTPCCGNSGGRSHQVHTGIALIHQAAHVTLLQVETARVRMTPFTDHELRRYLETEESLGKAGAYSIQGEGARFIEKIEGDYPTIVGLPLRQTADLLEQQGVVLPKSVQEIYRAEAVRELEGVLRPFCFGNW